MARNDSSIAGSKDWLVKLDKTIGKLGRAGFEDNLFDLVNTAVGVDHCAVFRNHTDGTTTHLFTKSKLSDDLCQSLAKAYTESFHTRDPHLAPLSASLSAAPSTKEGNETRVTLLPHRPTTAYDAAYKAQFFTETGLIDKVSSLLQTRQYNIYCSFYRVKRSGRFNQKELDDLSRILPILTNLIFQHARLSGQTESHPDPILKQLPLRRPSEAMSPLLDSENAVFSQLTDRERDVSIRILQGYSSEAISLDLKVALSTIHTYRKRAYRKLGISSQNELFSLYLEYIPMRAPAVD